MKIAVGTENKAKVAAVEKATIEYPMLNGAEVLAIAVNSDVNDQPKGLYETIEGAKNRARKAYEVTGADLAFGLESGVFQVPHTKSEWMDTTACAIFDGQNFHLGLSSCFEYPKKLVEKLMGEGKEVTDAAIELGFADDPKFREGQGMVGTLTKGRITRLDFSYQAVITAMIHLENADHY